MKPVSIDTLKRRALAMGGKVEVDGASFNAARTQDTVAPIKKVITPAVQAAPVEPSKPSEAERTLDSIAQMNKIQSKVLMHLRQLSLTKPTVREWHFTINRDAKDNLVSIKATCKE